MFRSWGEQSDTPGPSDTSVQGGLASVGAGLEAFIRNNGSMRLMASPEGWRSAGCGGIERPSGNSPGTCRPTGQVLDYQERYRAGPSVGVGLADEGKADLTPASSLVRKVSSSIRKWACSGMPETMPWASKDPTTKHWPVGTRTSNRFRSVGHGWIRKSGSPRPLQNSTGCGGAVPHSRSYSLPEAVRQELLAYAQYRPHPVPEPVVKPLQLYPASTGRL